jgi:hypothetical protein
MTLLLNAKTSDILAISWWKQFTCDEMIMMSVCY